MKIYINKPRNHWLSPYTILEKTLFWLDWDNIDYDTPWVKKWSDRITPFSLGLKAVLDFINPKITYIKIDGFDVWNADYTLALIILPILKKIKAYKSGIPYTFRKDGPEELWNDEDLKEEWSYNEERWNWILDEMIFAFESIVDNSWEDQFYSGESDWDFVDSDTKDKKGIPYKQMVEGPNHTFKADYKGLEEYQRRIRNGTTLFGKYYRSLWT